MNALSQYSRLLLGAVLVVMSLVMIFVVGYAQSLKSYERQNTEAVMAQSESAKLSIEQILNSGVALRDVSGLERMIVPLINDASMVVDVRVSSDSEELYRHTSTTQQGNLVSIPLRNKIAEVGTLELVLSHLEIERIVQEKFTPFYTFLFGLVILFLFAVIRNPTPKTYFVAFSTVFVVMSTCVIILVGSLYHIGLTNKANSTANIVTQRLSPILTQGIEIEYVSGLDKMLLDIQSANYELDSLTVTTQDQGVIATTAVNPSPNILHRLATFTIQDGGDQVHIGFKPRVIILQLLVILKNFAILFAACAFLCFSFMRLLTGSESQSKNSFTLAQIKPLLLVTILMESLMAPVLPFYLAELVQANGGDESWSSYFFALYFLGFALTILPASRLTERMDGKNILTGGVILSTIGCGLLSSNDHIYSVMFARFISGVGQSAILVAVQSYLMRCSDENNKTQSAGVIVYCFNAAFISGAAIGSLLAEYLNIKGVFYLSTFVGALMFMFGLGLPALLPQKKSNVTILKSFQVMLVDSAKMLAKPAFSRLMFLVGIPSKMMFTGVVTFAVPLLLAEHNVAKESIGQVMMAYAFSVLVVSAKITQFIDQRGNCKDVLSFGLLITTLALLTLSLSFSLSGSNENYLVLIATVAMLILGVAHGMINAPVTTYVVDCLPNDNPITVSSTYRFIERLGHVLGALVVGLLLGYLSPLLTFLILGIFFVFCCVFMWFLHQDVAPRMAYVSEDDIP